MLEKCRTSQIRWLMYCKSATVRVDSLNLILYLTGSQCSGFSRGSDGEKRGALSTTRARQFCTRCNLERSCLAMLFFSELQ